ncbi:hypothetical protein EGR_02295 [Echinococcus granulosus]|uniref:HMG box domain-containing protein n=1 Tax=Echinococcus granulosus TaxID=6210 RepID=W6V8J2_ECHGR|nr:hypothetical protein EGR_02295 [Echinococcus granulosus]EUB62854.1 hypothetical protein EGR_02295 [Echinococcus granulosus]
MGRPSLRSCNPRKVKRPRRRDSLKCKTKRPPGAYALFLQSMKSCYCGDLVAFSRLVAGKWRQLDAKQKAIYEKRAQSLKAKYNSPCKNSACSKYLKFVNAAYRCLRQQHPDWSSKQIRDAWRQDLLACMQSLIPSDLAYYNFREDSKCASVVALSKLDPQDQIF